MAVTPAPSFGAVLPGRDVPGRALRISAHPELGLVVLSIWQDERCVATVRVAEGDVPDLVHTLTSALLPQSVQSSQLRAIRAIG
jgi:hypothetical protein